MSRVGRRDLNSVSELDLLGFAVRPRRQPAMSADPQFGHQSEVAFGAFSRNCKQVLTGGWGRTECALHRSIRCYSFGPRRRAGG